MKAEAQESIMGVQSQKLSGYSSGRQGLKWVHYVPKLWDHVIFNKEIPVACWDRRHLRRK